MQKELYGNWRSKACTNNAKGGKNRCREEKKEWRNEIVKLLENW